MTPIDVRLRRLARWVGYAAAAATFALPLVPAAAHARQTPTRDLPAPGREFPDAFSRIAGALELRDGRVLVIDQVEGVMSVVDFATGVRRPVGGRGAGPGEYRVPTALGRLAEDTIWVFDGVQGRVVVFHPDLAPGATFPFIAFDASRGVTLTAPMLTNLSGQVFATELAVQPGADGRVIVPDEASIVRLDPRAGRAQTELARFRYPSMGERRVESSDDGRSMKFTLTYSGLGAADAWTVFRDGRVAIVRGASYSVEFISPGGERVAHDGIGYERFPVTAADRSAELAQARKMMAQQTQVVARTLPLGANVEFDVLAPEAWPDFYPPVAPMGAVAAADGHLWVKRATPARLDRELWDVIDERGRLVARWRLPSKTTLLSVGRLGVYVARTDNDELQHLHRVELPR